MLDSIVSFLAAEYLTLTHGVQYVPPLLRSHSVEVTAVQLLAAEIDPLEAAAFAGGA
jgi:hypothetical protein